MEEHAKGHLKGRVLSSDEFEAQSHKLEGLTPGQTEAAQLILTDKHLFTGADGVAGSGKSFLLEKTIPILKAQGYRVIGMAPTLKALDGLTDTQVFDKTLTTQKFHQNPIGNSKTALVIDEAGMVGNEIMHSILKLSLIHISEPTRPY